MQLFGPCDQVPPQPIKYSSQVAPAGIRSGPGEPAQPNLLDLYLPFSFFFPDKELNIIGKHGYPPFTMAMVLDCPGQEMIRVYPVFGELTRGFGRLYQFCISYGPVGRPPGPKKPLSAGICCDRMDRYDDPVNVRELERKINAYSAQTCTLSQTEEYWQSQRLIVAETTAKQ